MSGQKPGDMGKLRKYQDVDSGFAWFVLIGCFFMYMLVVGSFKSFGVVFTEMVEYYSTGSGETAWVASIILIVQLVLGPVANLLCKIYTFRLVTFIGGILFGLGYFLSGFVTRMEYMYLTFVSTGIGAGLTFAPCSTIISYYFDKRRALANGITVSGSGVGTIAIPFLYKYLIEKYGLKGTFWIIGALYSNVCVAACIFRQPRYLGEQKKENDRIQRNDEYEISEDQVSSGRSDENVYRRNDKSFCARLDLRFSLFRNVPFTLYVVSFMCCSFGYAGSLILIPANVKALGYDQTYVALSVTIFGGVEVVARILIGLFADLNIIERKYIYAVSMFIGGTVSLLAPFFENFTFAVIYASVAGIFLGSYFSLMSVLLIEVVGLENFSPAFGLFTLCMAVAILPSQPIAGWLYDLYGSWNPSFILTGCMFILAGIIILMEPYVERSCRRSRKKDASSADNRQQKQNDDETMNNTNAHNDISTNISVIS